MAAFVALGIVGCGGSSHSISTINGSTSASFSNKSVSAVIDVLTKSFGPLKGFTAEIPAELRGTKIDMEFSDATTIEPVQKALAEATGFDVEIDAEKRMIRFVKKSEPKSGKTKPSDKTEKSKE